MRWAWAAMSGLAALAGVGCGGDDGAGAGPGDRSAAPSSSAERAELRDYERAADDLVDGVHAVVQNAVDLQAAIADEDDAETDAQLDALPATLDDIEDAADRLQSAEEALGGNQYGDEPAVARAGLAFLPVLATLAGLASFARFLRGKNEEMNAQRERRDDACAAVADNTPGAIEDCQAARADMAQTGTEVIERMTQEVVTELVLSPVNPQSVGGLVLKQAAGQALQSGMTVLSSTEQCASMPPAEGCRVGIARTDASGQVPAPAGVLTISVSGKGIARVELDEVELAPDEVIDLILDLVDIESEGGEAGSSGGEGGRDGTSGSGGSGGSVSPGSCSHPDAVGTDVPVAVDIATQADVDALAGCTSVGGLDIRFDAEGVTTLTGLESLTEIRMVPDSLSADLLDIFSGSLEINGAPDLTDISALANLTRVDGHVNIDAPGLREVDLSALQSVGTGDMPSLPGVVVGGELVALVDLSSLERVVGEVHFTAAALDTLLLPKLQTIELDQGGYAGGFIMSSASRLAVLELPELTTIEGELWVYWCDALTAIQAPKLTEVRHHFRIDDNPALVTIGLDGVVEPTGGIYVSGNTVLESIGLNGVPSVEDTGMAGLGSGSVSIENNPALQQLGFAALTSIAGELSLSSNAMLSSETSQAFRDRVSVGGGN